MSDFSHLVELSCRLQHIQTPLVRAIWKCFPLAAAKARGEQGASSPVGGILSHI